MFTFLFPVSLTKLTWKAFFVQESWVVVDASLLEAELNRYMDKNGLSFESTKRVAKSDGPRIRLSLNKSKNVDKLGLKNETKSRSKIKKRRHANLDEERISKKRSKPSKKKHYASDGYMDNDTV